MLYNNGLWQIQPDITPQVFYCLHDSCTDKLLCNAALHDRIFLDSYCYPHAVQKTRDAPAAAFPLMSLCAAIFVNKESHRRLIWTLHGLHIDLDCTSDDAEVSNTHKFQCGDIKVVNDTH